MPPEKWYLENLNSHNSKMNKIDIVNYISKFGDISQLPRQVLLDELDKVWLDVNLDNSKPLSVQLDGVAKFYSHPVWILNGIFSELDSVSKSHREAIAIYINKLNVSRVADYGGGSGVLARIISNITSSQVDIIEPYASEFVLEKLNNYRNINVVSHLIPEYDVIVAQDVLEHVDDPIGLAVDLINATKMNGYLIFANCFYPDIKCHLPSTFYLRHTFTNLMAYAGLKLVERVTYAEHALVFKRIGTIQSQRLAKANSRAKVFGLFLNRIHGGVSKVRQFAKHAI